MTNTVQQLSDYQLLIVIGAARSGTNMLRDALVQVPGFATWPCDEINYIWRHYWASLSHDELQPLHATARVRCFLHGIFARHARKTGARWLVEKTCANSLRVDFIRTVFPKAKFVFLVRDGRDAVASALKRWSAKPDAIYLARKARQIPLRDLPHYAVRHLAHRIHQFTSRERRLGSWGPRFKGIDEMLTSHSLIEVCGEQWRRCVVQSAASFTSMPPGQICHLRYETFVNRPRHEFARVLDFLSAPATRSVVERATRNISAASVGKWQYELNAREITLVEPRIESALERIDAIFPADRQPFVA